jgi:hypothetical protein
MAKCRCITGKGEQCSRTAVSADGYCKQHSTNCKRSVTQLLRPPQQNVRELIAKKRVSFNFTPEEQRRLREKQERQQARKRLPIETKEEREQRQQTAKMIELNYGYDWTEHVKPGVKNGYDTYVIPKGTVLYRGTYIGTGRLRMATGAMFFGNFPVAVHYAFDNRDTWHPNYGKIVKYETVKDIEVLNMNTVTTLAALAKRYKTKNARTLIQMAFGFKDSKKGGIMRVSDYGTDDQFSQWFCSATATGGFGIINPPGFHSELMICDPSLVKDTGVEYRWMGYFDKVNAYEVQNGKLTGHKMPIDGTRYMYDGKLNTNHIRLEGRLPYLGKKDPFVKAENQRKEDFMDNKEIKAALKTFLIKHKRFIVDELEDPELFQELTA